MNRPTQSGVLLLTGVLALTACDRRGEASRAPDDSKIRRAIVGTWGVEVSNVAGVVTLRPDSGFSGYWSNMLRPKGWRFDGQWGISNGALVTKWTNASFWNYTNDYAPGDEKTWKIQHLNADELVFDTNGVAGVWKRKN
jgi:hypothetical protein